MPPRKTRSLIFLICLTWLVVSPAHAAPPKTVVSIKPLHSLIAALMKGAANPDLLISSGASVHHAALKPSDARAIKGAELFVWTGPQMETWLRKPLNSLLPKYTRVIAVSDLPGLARVRVRSLSGHDHDHHGHRHSHNEKKKRPIDQHFWLDPVNAIIIAERAATALVALDPENKQLYANNRGELVTRLRAIIDRVKTELYPHRATPFVVFHDAYRYFEMRFQLRNSRPIALRPDISPGARQLDEIIRWIGAAKAKCIFAEPQFSPALVTRLVTATGVKAGILDPLGGDIAPGPELYPALIVNLSKSITNCLAQQGVR